MPVPLQLLPREHGAYAELLLPLTAALCIAPSSAGFAWALGASTLFLLHDPVLVLLGHRGQRRLDRDRHAATMLAFWLASSAALFLVTAGMGSGVGSLWALVPA